MGLQVHKSDIKAMIEKRGATLSQIDRDSDFREGTCRDALRKHRPKAELAICEFLHLPPHVVFPDRYHSNNQRIDRRRKSANVETTSTISTNVTSKT